MHIVVTDEDEHSSDEMELLPRFETTPASHLAEPDSRPLSRTRMTPSPVAVIERPVLSEDEFEKYGA